MSEEKIIQHSKKAIEAATNKIHTWKEKLKEVALEIVIIIFAVSVTLMMHNWNDQRHERKMEKEFLIGIQEDLKKASNQLTLGIEKFKPTIAYYDIVWQQIVTKRMNLGYIDTNSHYLINKMYFQFDNGRFEGFKSSGNLNVIENNELLTKILRLYTIEMPFQELADAEIFKGRRDDFNTYIGVKAPLDNSGNLTISKIIDEPAVKYQIKYYGNFLHERENQKKELVKKIKKVIDAIAEELKDR